MYACLSKVFDISRVARLLKDLEPNQRQACVDSFYFEGQAHLRDPTLGCLGLIRHHLRRLQHAKLGLEMAKRALKALQEAHPHHDLELGLEIAKKDMFKNLQGTQHDKDLELRLEIVKRELIKDLQETQHHNPTAQRQDHQHPIRRSRL